MNLREPRTILRVAQWATGNIGLRALREVVRHPGLELVGVLVYDEAKVGVDAGLLCGEAPLGIESTNDSAAIVALHADCVLYMPRRFDVDEVAALLAAGTNVVTTCGECFDGGRALDSEHRRRILDACTQGASSIYSTGSSPGFITDALPYALLSLQREVESIEIEEFANLSRRNSPHLLFELMGFGRAPEAVDERRSSHLLDAFGPSLGALARSAALDVEDWSVTGAIATARVTTRLAAGDLAAGTVAAQRSTISGRGGASDLIRFTTNWYCADDIVPAWDLRPTGWRVRIRGDAPLDVELRFPIALDELGAFTPAYTANRPVNAVPYVCAAPQGIVETIDLSPIVPAGPR